MRETETERETERETHTTIERLYVCVSVSVWHTQILVERVKREERDSAEREGGSEKERHTH